MPASLVGSQAFVGGRVVIMARAKRDDSEQVLVRVIRGAGPAVRTGTPRTKTPTDDPAVGHEPVTFYESRRSGNVGIAINSSLPFAEKETGLAERILSADPERLPIRPQEAETSTEPASHSRSDEVSAAAALHDLHPYPTADAGPSEDEIIGHIMASDPERPAAAAVFPMPGAAMLRTPSDPQLSRVVDAWPGLAPTARQAVIAILDAVPHACGPVSDDEGRGDAQRRKPTRAKDRATPARTEPRRRRTRKPASP